MMLQIPFEYWMWEAFDHISSNSYNHFIDVVMDANRPLDQLGYTATTGIHTGTNILFKDVR